MFSKIIAFTVFVAALPGVGNAASCSVINLNRCLDSVCAINISTNPAARCQYCGTADAGTPPQSKMRNVSVGQSSKNTISEKELKNAPDDPGARYAWAKAECFKKIANCTDDDTEQYYEMIQKSCDTVGTMAKKDNLVKKALKSTATKSSCTNDMTVCMMGASRCGGDWSACATDASFDTFFASCSVDATGCDEFMDDIRTQLSASRTSTIEGAAERIQQIAISYQTSRKNAVANAQDVCKTNKNYDNCVKDVCATSMPNKCAAGTRHDDEIAAAGKMCQFYKIACNTITGIQQ